MSRTYHKLRESRRRGAKAFDPHCRNHGSCDWCKGNRTHKHAKANMEDLQESMYFPEEVLCKWDDEHQEYLNSLFDDFIEVRYKKEKENGNTI